jgi:XTP/dITP diphosphohydrolase
VERILMATNNQGKQCEFRHILADLPFALVAPQDIGLDLEVEESGQTFSENALLKARALVAGSGIPALADDSGLEVEILDAAPGIYSARFGGKETETERNDLLLRWLQDVPDERRKAEFVCVIGFASPYGDEWTVEGRVHGTITREPRGNHGFGYDPVFLVPEFHTTFAEMSPEQKNRLSHRRRALEKAHDRLRKLYGTA